MIEKPIPKSHWVLPGRFLAGEYPALGQYVYGTRLRLAAFLKAGFYSFIDLTRRTSGHRISLCLKRKLDWQGWRFDTGDFLFLILMCPPMQR